MSITLRTQLANINEEKYIRFRNIERHATSILEYSQGSSNVHFTPHGISHITKVEQNADILLNASDIANLNANELFILLVSILFHDVFMIPKTLDGADDARARHALDVKENIRRINSELNLTPHEINAVSEVIRAHAVDNIAEIQKETVIGADVVDLQKLGAVLSLADICHADSSRAPVIVFRYLQLAESSARHWRRHLQIGGITRRGEEILISAIAFSKSGEAAIQEYVEFIRQQLVAVKPFFHSVLQPIRDVSLSIAREASEVRRLLRFQADVGKILDLLMTGVYSRDDVFIRELLQNSFDACAIRKADQINDSSYFPTVLFSFFYNKDNQMESLRIDDNGVGMSISDFEDTLLWIGRSIVNDKDLADQVFKQTGKKLIARFGIGLLSCFKVSDSIFISSCRDGETPFFAEIRSIFDEIKSEKSKDDHIGATFLLRFKDAFRDREYINSAFRHYFRNTHFAQISIREEHDEKRFYYGSRKELLEFADMSTDLDDFLDEAKENDEEKDIFNFEADDESAHVELRLSSFSIGDGIPPGKIEICNQGIYVATLDAEELFPRSLRALAGRIDLAPGTVDLAASRSDVARNAKFEELKARLLEYVSEFFAKLVAYLNALAFGKQIASDEAKIRQIKFFMVHCYQDGDQTIENYIISALAKYPVRLGGRYVQMSSTRPVKSRIFLTKKNTRFVKEIFTFDTKDYFAHMESDVEFMEYAIRQNGYSVLEYAVFEEHSDIDEKDILMDWFMRQGVDAVDISVVSRNENDLGPPEARLRSLPVPTVVREHVGKNVKIVQSDDMTRLAWKVGDELWINIGNKKMFELYVRMKDGKIRNEDKHLVRSLADILWLRFDSAVDRLTNAILQETLPS